MCEGSGASNAIDMDVNLCAQASTRDAPLKPGKAAVFCNLWCVRPYRNHTEDGVARAECKLEQKIQNATITLVR